MTLTLCYKQADSDVLRAAASSLNRFEGDGSFMQQFGDGPGAHGSPPASDSDADRFINAETLTRLFACMHAVIRAPSVVGYYCCSLKSLKPFIRGCSP